MHGQKDHTTVTVGTNRSGTVTSPSGTEKKSAEQHTPEGLICWWPAQEAVLKIEAAGCSRNSEEQHSRSSKTWTPLPSRLPIEKFKEDVIEIYEPMEDYSIGKIMGHFLGELQRKNEQEIIDYDLTWARELQKVEKVAGNGRVTCVPKQCNVAFSHNLKRSREPSGATPLKH